MPKKTKVLPLLPLRGILVFPNMVLHLDVGRERSINALEQAMRSEERRVGKECINRWGPFQ